MNTTEEEFDIGNLRAEVGEPTAEQVAYQRERLPPERDPFVEIATLVNERVVLVGRVIRQATTIDTMKDQVTDYRKEIAALKKLRQREVLVSAIGALLLMILAAFMGNDIGKQNGRLEERAAAQADKGALEQRRKEPSSYPKGSCASQTAECHLHGGNVYVGYDDEGVQCNIPQRVELH